MSDFQAAQAQRDLAARESQLYKLVLEPNIVIALYKYGCASTLIKTKLDNTRFTVELQTAWKNMIESLLPTLENGDKITVEVVASGFASIKSTYRSFSFEKDS